MNKPTNNIIGTDGDNVVLWKNKTFTRSENNTDFDNGIMSDSDFNYVKVVFPSDATLVGHATGNPADCANEVMWVAMVTGSSVDEGFGVLYNEPQACSYVEHGDIICYGDGSDSLMPTFIAKGEERQIVTVNPEDN